jgi:hypothetical protein
MAEVVVLVVVVVIMTSYTLNALAPLCMEEEVVVVYVVMGVLMTS